MQIPLDPENEQTSSQGTNNSDHAEVPRNPWFSSSYLRNVLKKRLPILEWFPEYRKKSLMGDVIAGVAVGLTVVPQSMAYAEIAGLTPVFGLYSSYIGSLLYFFFGSVKQVTIGPTAIMGLLTFESCGINFPQCVILTSFYSGAFELLLALLQLGWIVQFISEAVVLGFTSGAAVTIISSQIKSFLGLEGPKGNGFIGYWTSIINNWKTIHTPDAIMGIVSFAMLLLLREMKDFKPSWIGEGRRGEIASKLFWLLSISRNVIIILSTSLLAYLWPGDQPPFKLTGKVVGGFPGFQPPSFQLPFNATTADDLSSYLSIWDSWSILGTGPLVVALISILQNVAISKAFGGGQDMTQEMYALGLSNIFGSFFSSIPISGSFSRSAVNESSGVQSQLGGVFTGLLVLLSLGFLTPSFFWIPKSSLAAVIISAVMFMIELKPLNIMFQINRLDLLSCIVTFLFSILLGMEWGILVGVGLTFALLLFQLLKPTLNSQILTDPISGVTYLYTLPDSGIAFPALNYIRTTLATLDIKYPNVSVMVINFEKISKLDYTIVTGLASMLKFLRKEKDKKKKLIFLNLTPEWINAFRATGLELIEIPHCNLSDLPNYLRKANETNVELEENSPLKRSSQDYGTVVPIDPDEPQRESLTPLL